MHIICFDQSHSSLFTHTIPIISMPLFKRKKKHPGITLRTKMLFCSDWDSELNSLVMGWKHG